MTDIIPILAIGITIALTILGGVWIELKGSEP